MQNSRIEYIDFLKGFLLMCIFCKKKYFDNYSLT